MRINKYFMQMLNVYFSWLNDIDRIILTFIFRKSILKLLRITYFLNNFFVLLFNNDGFSFGEKKSNFLHSCNAKDK